MEQRAAALEQAIEKDLAAVEAKTKEGLAKAAGAAKLTEDEIVEELEDLQQGVRRVLAPVRRHDGDAADEPEGAGVREHVVAPHMSSSFTSSAFTSAVTSGTAS